MILVGYRAAHSDHLDMVELSDELQQNVVSIFSSIGGRIVDQARVVQLSNALQFGCAKFRVVVHVEARKEVKIFDVRFTVSLRLAFELSFLVDADAVEVQDHLLSAQSGSFFE